MSKLRILVVSHSFPPLNVISTYRLYHWVKYWSRLGHDVTVLTTKKYGFEGNLDFLPMALENTETVEVDYLPSILKSHLAEGRSRPTIPEKTHNASWMRHLSERALRILRNNCGQFAHPTAFWIKPAARVGKRLLRTQGFDAVVSSFGPASAHAVAAMIVNGGDSPIWIADYRDRWTGNPALSITAIGRCLDTIVERKVLKAADGLICVSENDKSHYSDWLDKDCIVIPNGFDPDEYPFDDTIEVPPEFEASRTNLVYAGKIYDGRRDPSSLLHAIEKYDLQSEVLLHFYGDRMGQLQTHFKGSAGEVAVRFHGYRSRPEILKILRAADGLLLLEAGDDASKGILPGKLFEYLAVRRPILALGIKKGFESAQVIERCGVGLVSEDQPELIRDFVIDPQRFYDPKSVIIADYQRDVQAAQAIDFIRTRLCC